MRRGVFDRAAITCLDHAPTDTRWPEPTKRPAMAEALRAGLRLLEREEAEMDALRQRLQAGMAEARAGDLAEGSGEEAIRRAFRAARGAV